MTADGDVVTASETEHTELFWALHGGGGNFGVATALTFRLQPVGPTVLAGLLLHKGEAGAAALRRARDLMAVAPDELGMAFAWITGPAEEGIPAHLHGERVAASVVCWSGDVEEGEALIASLRTDDVEADLVGPVPYADFNCSLDDPPGFRNWWTAEHLDALSDEVIDIVAEHAMRQPIGPAQTFLVPWGGAVARQGEPLAAGAARRDVGRAPVRPVGGRRARRRAHRLGARHGERRAAARQRRRVPQLHRRRGGRAHPGGVRRREPRAPARGQGALRPAQRVPPEPQHRAGTARPRAQRRATRSHARAARG